MRYPARVRQIARERFGFDRLRPGQEEAMVSVLEGHDTLAVMPARFGKSAIYQVPALLIPGHTVVVSLLPGSSRQQSDSPISPESAHATGSKPAIPGLKRGETFEELRRYLEFLFLAPEQFHAQETLDRLRAAAPSLFVVDEAQCISEWSRDFRPNYSRLGAIIEELGHPIVIALAATAGPAVRRDIVTRLGMSNPRVIVRGFDRPNIWLGVRSFPSEQAKHDAFLEAVKGAAKPGIVYVSSRRHAEEIARDLSDSGVSALFYHSGMLAKQRDPARARFLSGNCDVMVATSPLGIGIDKPDIRFAFHYEISSSLDAYHQEIGLAGRDGHAAQAVLFYEAGEIRKSAPGQELLQEFELLRLEDMRAYAELDGCRRQFLLRYFGEDGPDRCESCDYCQSNPVDRASEEYLPVVHEQ